MSELILVDHPVVHPHACVLCGSQKGPIIDTAVERWDERLYLCRMCATKAARTYGLVKGPRMDALMLAADTLTEKERELDDLLNEVARLNLETRSQQTTIREQGEKIVDQGGRLRAMMVVIAEAERQLTELGELAAGTQVELSAA